MPIKQIDPPAFDESNSVLIDSDAATNELAIREIDAWAAANGFVRTGEYWLRVVVRDGRRLFRGQCYRMTPEERAAAEASLDEIQERAERLALRRPA